MQHNVLAKHKSTRDVVVKEVQGLDYAYTLQGWLKGVNSTAVGTGQYDAGNVFFAATSPHR